VALGLMGARNATPVIESLVRDTNDPALQRAGATALGLMGDRNVLELLASILKSTDSEFLMSSAAMALGTIGDHTAIEPLLAASRARGSLTGTTRAYATMALGLLGEPTDAPKMSLVARDVNYRAQIDAVKTLLNML
jgi:HEAT repeat protein